MFKKLSFLVLLCLTYSANSQVLPETEWIHYADTSWYDDSLDSFDISDPESFAGISALVESGNNFDTKIINITADIDLGEHLWLPIGTNINLAFKGNVEGNGHTISNLFVNRPENDFAGLFGAVLTTEIKNLNIDHTIIHGQGTVAALVANLSTHSLVENCHITDAKIYSATGWNGGGAGGIAGGFLSNSTIKKSSYSGEVHGGDQIGGLVGTAWDTTLIEESYSEGLVSGDNIVGGLIGYCTWNFPPQPNTTNVVKNSFSRSNVIATGIMAGGFYGSPEINAAIENCYSTGTVNAPNADGTAGGFIGRIVQETTVINSYFDTQSSEMTSGIGEFTPGPGIDLVAKTTDEMKSQQMVDLLNADQENIWSLDSNQNDGYPILANIILSVEDAHSISNEAILYPSITETSINLLTSIPSEFTIIDATGRILDKGIIQNKEVNYNVTHLNAGIYLVIFESENQKSVKRFIKK